MPFFSPFFVCVWRIYGVFCSLSTWLVLWTCAPYCLLSQRFRWVGHWRGWMEEKGLDICILVYHIELVPSLLSAPQLSGAQAVLRRSCFIILGFSLCPFLRLHVSFHIYIFMFCELCSGPVHPYCYPCGCHSAPLLHCTSSIYFILFQNTASVLVHFQGRLSINLTLWKQFGLSQYG